MLLHGIVLGVCIAWNAPHQAASAETTVVVERGISLQDAVRQGKVKVEVRSRGGATGSTVRVEVQRLVPDDLRVEVASGTVLLNPEDSEQNMTVGQLKGEVTGENRYRPGQVMVLADDRRHAFLLEVYCLDYAKKSPRQGGRMELAVRDERVARILNFPAGVQPSLGAVQIAIWMDRAGIGVEEARRRYRGAITEVDVQVARQLLAHAEQTGVATVPQEMPAAVRVHVTKLFSADPAIREQAAKSLGELGAEALSAAPFLAENLLDRAADRPLPANVARVDVGVAVDLTAAALERLNMPALAPLIETLRRNVGAAGATPPGNARELADAQRSTAGGKSLRAAAGLVREKLVDGWIAGLANAQPSARERAARLLGASGDQRAVEPLIQLLGDEDERVRSAAARALRTLTHQDFGADADQWRAWWSKRN